MGAAGELFTTDDPTGQMQAAWAGRELLRQLLDALPAVDGPLVIDPPPGPHRRQLHSGSRAAAV